MDLGIKGKRAIVTGGGSGIGFETARQFLEEGVRVLIAGRTARQDQQGARRTGQEDRRRSSRCASRHAKEADIKRMVETAKEKLGGVDILINNAGTMYSGRFAVLKDDELKKQLETKLFGFMRAIRMVYPLMKAQKWGRIVNTIGGAGKEPDPYMFGSAMTNSALLNLTKSLSEEFGPDNVLVNAICPGWVATNLWVQNTEGLKKEFNVTTEEEARKLAAKKNSWAAWASRKNSPMRRCSCVRSAPAILPASRLTSTAGGSRGSGKASREAGGKTMQVFKVRQSDDYADRGNLSAGLSDQPNISGIVGSGHGEPWTLAGAGPLRNRQQENQAQRPQLAAPGLRQEDPDRLLLR